MLLLILTLTSCSSYLPQIENDISAEIEIQQSIDIIFYDQIMESFTQLQQERQQQIIDYENLPGTFWVIEDPVNDPFGNTLEPNAYIFIGDNIVVIVRARPTMRADGFWPKVLFSVAAPLRYNITDDKLIIIPGFLDGYLEDTYLFFGSSNFGYARYKLESTFSPLRN